VEPATSDAARADPEGGGRRWLPGPADLLCAGLAAMLVVTHGLLTLDTWWHLTLGAATLRDGRIPAADTLSWTAAGAPLASHAWAFDAAAALLERWGGLGLLEVAGALLVAATLRQAYLAGRGLGAGAGPALLAVTAGALVSLQHLILRPQLVTYLCFAWLLRATIEHRAGRSRALLAAPLVTLVWSNLHGGFLLGPAFLLGVGALDLLGGLAGDDGGRPRARLMAVLAALSLVAACVHPSGPRQFVDALVNTPLVDPIHQRIDEWRPPDLAVVGLRAWVVAALGLALLAPRPTLFEAATVLGGFFVALATWRSVPLLAFGAGPVLAAWATRALVDRRELVEARAPAAARLARGLERGLAWPGGGPGGLALLVVAAVAGAAVVIARPPDVLDAPAVANRHPVAAARWVAAHDLRGRLLNSYMWGGYLGWALPGHPVAIDSRMLPFRDFLPDYATLLEAEPGWEEVLARRGIEWALLERWLPLTKVLRADPGWRLVHEDGVAVVFVRRGGPNDGVR
jgi:hypothetical protein